MLWQCSCPGTIEFHTPQGRAPVVPPALSLCPTIFPEDLLSVTSPIMLDTGGGTNLGFRKGNCSTKKFRGTNLEFMGGSLIWSGTKLGVIISRRQRGRLA